MALFNTRKKIGRWRSHALWGLTTLLCSNSSRQTSTPPRPLACVEPTGLMTSLTRFSKSGINKPTKPRYFKRCFHLIRIAKCLRQSERSGRREFKFLSQAINKPVGQILCRLTSATTQCLTASFTPVFLAQPNRASNTFLWLCKRLTLKPVLHYLLTTDQRM